MNEKVTQLGSEREYYYRTRSFIEDTAALKVIDGKTVREIFVENQISPKTAFILAEAMSEADKALIVDAITEARRYISLLNERIAKLAS